MKSILRVIIVLFCTIGTCSTLFSGEINSGEKIRILILSGRNNHAWQETTPLLEHIFRESGRFDIEITNRPDTLSYGKLIQFGAIVSNWNSFPEKDVLWPKEAENGLLIFLKEGGGLVFFHASTTAFYNWPEFKKFSTGAWIDSTWHGNVSATKVFIQNNEHPVTKGLSDFFIQDELWVNAEKNELFETLGTASNTFITEKSIENQPIVMVSEFGKGRIFHTGLGHDVRAMRNIGFQTLMLRGTEWAATGMVKQQIPQELRLGNKTEKSFSWAKTDSSFALLQNEELLWKYNFNEKHGKPFFNPVYVGNNNLTCVSPDDHPWHVGQWFSWKYINGVNYWEYKNGTFQSEGVTEIRNIEIKSNIDFSAEIELDIIYHRVKGENVLSEKRKIMVSSPRENVQISMDYEFEFEALVDSVNLDRTPILGEPNGMSWGGYAGISLRFNQSFMDSHFISDFGNDEDINGKSANWVYMGLTGIDGKKVGSQIMVAPNTYRDYAAWYVINENGLPFYFFSPAYLYKKPMVLLKGKKIKLNYRINHIPGEVSQTDLEREFKEYKNQ